MRVSNFRIRAALKAVDPWGSEQRRWLVTHRRVYKVGGPNALWHLDANLKLVKWGKICIHGPNFDLLFFNYLWSHQVVSMETLSGYCMYMSAAA